MELLRKALKSKRVTPFCLLPACLLLFIGPAYGDDWKSIGPYGGYLSSIVVDPNQPGTVYALGRGQIFKSKNGGESWRNISPTGLTSYSRPRLVISSEYPGHLYLIGGKGKLLESIDEGEKWTKYFLDSVIQILFISPHDLDYFIAYKTLDRGLYDPWPHTLVKTTDGGFTWVEISNGIDTTLGPIQVWVNPYHPDQIMAQQLISYGGDVIDGQIVYVSSNGGGNWKLNEIGGNGVRSVEFDPQTTEVLYIHTYDGWRKTIDGATTWFGIPTEQFPSELASLIIDPNNSSVLYGVFESEQRDQQSIYKSMDGGLTLDEVGIVSPAVSIISMGINPQESSTLYAGIYPYGIFKSSDSGINWHQETSGLHMTDVYSMAAVSADHIYAGVSNIGIMRTRDRGNTWDIIIDNTSTTPGKVVISQSNPSLIYSDALPSTLYSADPTWAETGGLAVSDDGGDSWEYLRIGWRGFRIFDISFDGHIIYGSVFLGDIDGLITSGIIMSSNGGRSWDLLDLGIEGVNWIEKIEVDPSNADILYALLWLRGGVDQNIIVKSTDGGTHWNIIAENVNSFYLNTTNPSYLYYQGGAPDLQFYVSDNRGATWTFQSTSPGFHDLVVHPADAQTSFASTMAVPQEILVSYDHGQSWSALSQVAHGVVIHDLAVVLADSIYLFGSSRRGGVKLLPQPKRNSTNGTKARSVISKLSLSVNYPNPFNNRTTIKYALPVTANVSLEIYDLAGRNVRQLFNDSRHVTGEYTAAWDGKDGAARDLPSGIYIARLTAMNLTKSIKMVLLK
ncbi:MAG: T9SS type A sorting domain-containing protein [Candidatus Marinimicrobia bacterium]|nr:T9SS type A sorting domain-containing protein [Candidatus Neomarinimicrobiota bacterium]